MNGSNSLRKEDATGYVAHDIKLTISVEQLNASNCEILLPQQVALVDCDITVDSSEQSIHSNIKESWLPLTYIPNRLSLLPVAARMGYHSFLLMAAIFHAMSFKLCLYQDRVMLRISSEVQSSANSLTHYCRLEELRGCDLGLYSTVTTSFIVLYMWMGGKEMGLMFIAIMFSSAALTANVTMPSSNEQGGMLFAGAALILEVFACIGRIYS